MKRTWLNYQLKDSSKQTMKTNQLFPEMEASAFWDDKVLP